MRLGSFLVAKPRQQLRDEGDPVPNGSIALVLIELGRQSPFGVIQTQKPKDPSKQLSRLGILE